ncbi:ribokinase [Salipaludibacillus agaradhaerens]|uniref:Ribokinase n=1 Tax=Salipaludibacillus agaradhaerens TaxID=76935 RepID=A0A9Q4AZ45_SALAG|nr:ribokinase [Salipaludibacillus agaradhaerens]MCR6095436.1 ribokinase [Salipaludibacillus agaradhaerens]MCR6115004.1 ribokinase [Salipaludibacillus agaradhaerens]
MKKPVVTVIGSLNMDLVTQTNSFPVKGETVIGDHFMTVPGGKGANQAVAAARLGANVNLIGRVGDDPFGEILLRNLTENSVFKANVEPVTDCATGVATIILHDRDNRIIVTPGANNYVTKEYIVQHENVILTSDIVLLQMEIPLPTIEFVLQLCEASAVPVILNPAPAHQLSEEAWQRATYLTPNETEKELLFGKEPSEYLREKLIVTEGKHGVSFFESGSFDRVDGWSVTPVDTTGAGDTFNGAMAVALAEGKSKAEAITFANAAAAMSIQKLGAQGGMPTRQALEEFIQVGD